MFRCLIAADVVVTVQVALIGVSDFNSADVMVTVEVTLIRVPELIAAGCSGHRRGRIDRCFRSLFHRRDGHGRGHNDYVSGA